MLDTLVLAGAKIGRADSLSVASGGSECLRLLSCAITAGLNSSIMAMGGTVDEMHELLWHLGQLVLQKQLSQHRRGWVHHISSLLLLQVALQSAPCYLHPPCDGSNVHEIDQRDNWPLGPSPTKPRALQVPADQSLQNAFLLAPNSCIFNLARE